MTKEVELKFWQTLAKILSNKLNAEIIVKEKGE